MNAYLTSEVVVDYADGLINRREALRRLSLMGVGAALAASMLAACTDPAPAPGAGASAPVSAAGPARFIKDMRSALDELHRRAPAARLAAMGFCFGGAPGLS
ncbi:hypothetical protein ABT369_15545 [Dactylosporangium sp. NPDC000244]|uniref:hypothetical protein n=1 Tax=Dactylosporangium sp. NPDC000244 TaxID=3154365 RepID=UPI0033246FA5